VDGVVRVGDIACGRSGDKAATLDLTLVARDEAAYALLALKFVVTDAMPGGVYATLHAGMHWQKAAIAILLDMEIAEA
jgi:hypothetical protein